MSFQAPFKKQICKAVSWSFTILYRITRTESRLTVLSLSEGLDNRRTSIGREKLRAYSWNLGARCYYFMFPTNKIDCSSDIKIFRNAGKRLSGKRKWQWICVGPVFNNYVFWSVNWYLRTATACTDPLWPLFLGFEPKFVLSSAPPAFAR